MDAKVAKESVRGNGLPNDGNGETSELKIALTYLHSVFATVTSQARRRVTIDCLAEELRDCGIRVEKDKLPGLLEEAEKLELVTITGKVVNGRDYRRYRLTAKGEDTAAPSKSSSYIESTKNPHAGHYNARGNGRRARAV